VLLFHLCDTAATLRQAMSQIINAAYGSLLATVQRARVDVFRA
jgi:hypothetical protein